MEYIQAHPNNSMARGMPLITLTSNTNSSRVHLIAGFSNACITGHLARCLIDCNAPPEEIIAAYMHAWDLVVSGTESPDSDD